MSITVIASGEVGFRCLDWLLRSGYPVNKIFLGRSNDRSVSELCDDRDLPYLVFDQEAFRASGSNEWLLSLWNPNILSSDLLEMAKHRLNLHPSLVPHCRGNDTAAWTIRTGVPAGVSLLEMDPGVDTGAIWAQRKLDVTPMMTGGHLLRLMRDSIVDLFRDEWPAIFDGQVTPRPQEGVFPAYTRRQTNMDRIRTLSQFPNVESFLTWVRAHDFGSTSTAEIILDGRQFPIAMCLDKETKMTNDAREN